MYNLFYIYIFPVIHHVGSFPSVQTKQYHWIFLTENFICLSIYFHIIIWLILYHQFTMIFLFLQLMGINLFLFAQSSMLDEEFSRSVYEEEKEELTAGETRRRLR